MVFVVSILPAFAAVLQSRRPDSRDGEAIMPDFQRLSVVLKDRDTGEAVSGGLLTVDECDPPWNLPCRLSLPAGRHTLEARHASRAICQPNPRTVEVEIVTDPDAPIPVERFEVEPA